MTADGKRFGRATRARCSPRLPALVADQRPGAHGEDAAVEASTRAAPDHGEWGTPISKPGLCVGRVRWRISRRAFPTAGAPPAASSTPTSRGPPRESSTRSPSGSRHRRGRARDRGDGRGGAEAGTTRATRRNPRGLGRLHAWRRRSKRRRAGRRPVRVHLLAALPHARGEHAGRRGERHGDAPRALRGGRIGRRRRARRALRVRRGRAPADATVKYLLADVAADGGARRIKINPGALWDGTSG